MLEVGQSAVLLPSLRINGQPASISPWDLQLATSVGLRATMTRSGQLQLLALSPGQHQVFVTHSATGSQASASVVVRERQMPLAELVLTRRYPCGRVELIDQVLVLSPGERVTLEAAGRAPCGAPVRIDPRAGVNGYGLIDILAGGVGIQLQARYGRGRTTLTVYDALSGVARNVTIIVR
jgi:hypothetical protein